MTRILVVDDDVDLRETIVDVLSDRGFEVLAAEHGAAALEAVRARDLRPDLILLDINMPVMDGPAFASACKDEPRLAGVPVIAMTAQRDRRLAERETGAVTCLAKPVKLDTLIAAITAALSEPRRVG